MCDLSMYVDTIYQVISFVDVYASIVGHVVCHVGKVSFLPLKTLTMRICFSFFSWILLFILAALHVMLHLFFYPDI
jgi:hypothetical protein